MEDLSGQSVVKQIQSYFSFNVEVVYCVGFNKKRYTNI